MSTALYKSDQHQQRTRNEDVQNQPKKDHKQTLNSTLKNDDRNEMLFGWLSVGDVSREKQNHRFVLSVCSLLERGVSTENVGMFRIIELA